MNYTTYLEIHVILDALMSEEILTWDYKPELAFPVHITSGVGEMSVWQPKDDTTVQKFTLFFIVVVKNHC